LRAARRWLAIREKKLAPPGGNSRLYKDGKGNPDRTPTMATPLTEASLGGFPLLLKREEFTPSGSHKDADRADRTVVA
jgi:hypothetical protein